MPDIVSTALAGLLLLVAQAAPPPPAPPSAAAQGPVRAGVTDEATGLTVAPPEPFVASRSTIRGQDVTINIVSTTGVPPSGNSNGVLCGVAFKAAAVNESLTQAQLNELIGAPEWATGAKERMSAVFDFTSSQKVDLAGVTGVEFWARPKMGPRSSEVSVYLVMFETPKGRTTMSCATWLDKADEAKPHFAAIRNSITLPR